MHTPVARNISDTMRTSAELYREANDALLIEVAKNLRPGKSVTFKCINLTDSHHNYDVIVYVDRAFRIVTDLNHFARYTDLDIPGLVVESGHMRSSKIAAFPLIAGFAWQFVSGAYLVSVSVVDVVMR